MNVEKNLQAFKKRTTDGKWNYRNLIIAKDGLLWKIKIDEKNSLLNDKKTTTINEYPGHENLKDVCLFIDDVLGATTFKIKKPAKRLNNKKNNENTPSISEKTTFNVDDAKRLAYDFRWSLAKKLPENTNTVPVKREEGKKNYKITWNKDWEIADELLTFYNEKYGENFEFEFKHDDNSELNVKLK